MNRGIAIVVPFVLLTGTLAAVSHTQETNQVAGFMVQKLEHSKGVLEGLTTEDFDMIACNFSAMALLSQEANWQVLQTEEYLQQSIEFRRSAEALTRAAEAENLDAAALAYADLTMKCVTCHKYVRDVRLCRFEPVPPLRPVPR